MTEKNLDAMEFDEFLADAAANLDNDNRVPKRYIDEQTGDRLIVTKVCDEQADEYVVTLDHEKNPVTVADFEGNEEYPDDDTVVEAVYESDLEQFDDPNIYAFPLSRLAYPNSDDDDDDDDDDELPPGEPFTHSELAELTADNGHDEGSDELSLDGFFERHYFRGRKRATVVPARMRDFHLVCHAYEPDGDVDLIYEGEHGLVRLTRTSPDGGDYMATHETTDDTETLGTWSSSSKAIDAIARRMANVSGTTGDAA